MSEVPTGKRHFNWRGGRSVDPTGRVLIYAPDHPDAKSRSYVLEHRLVAEKALGKPLPSSAVVHHVNEDPGDNRPENLVLCEDRAYHNLLHRRMRARDAIGDADGLRCRYCKTYDHRENLNIYTEKTGKVVAQHSECNKAHMRRWQARRKA